MKKDETGPRTILGVRVKTIVILFVFSGLLLIAVNSTEIESLLQKTGIDKSLEFSSTGDSIAPRSQGNHIAVDQEMLEEAMREVQVERLSQLESGNTETVTDRFFYIVELHGGSDLEGVDLVIEPDYVTIVSKGGTETTLERAMVKEIKRFKLPPSQDN